jgi:hypothetical protein
MGLTQAQQSLVERARAVGAGDQGVALSDDACAFVVATIARDLGVAAKIPGLPDVLPEFFSSQHPASLVVPDANFLAWLERLLAVAPDADTYFACLAKLHRSRVKYQKILETQPVPTLEQVGPRGLLQYGHLSPAGLTALLFWRKWMFDIDNRAGQETGYLFEPIIASAIGGVSASSKRSPVRRKGAKSKGRQVDCIKDKRAYEFKIRVTIAASGQGRWREELEFPQDCRSSGFVPVLVVLDSTSNPKLDELRAAFVKAKGEVFVGDAAWEHLESAAGATMSVFLEKYVRAPLRDLLETAPARLPDLLLRDGGGVLSIGVGTETLTISRSPSSDFDMEEPLPDDVDEEAGGP